MGKIRRKKLIKQVQEDSAPYQLVHRHNENQSQELDALQLGQIESKSIVEENCQHLEEPKTLQENEQKQEISFEEPPTQKEESELTRGKVLQRQKIEYKKLREQIQKLSQEKAKYSKRNLNDKQKKKEISRQIKKLKEKLQEKHEKEVESFVRKEEPKGSESKPFSFYTQVKPSKKNKSYLDPNLQFKS